MLLFVCLFLHKLASYKPGMDWATSPMVTEESDHDFLKSCKLRNGQDGFKVALYVFPHHTYNDTQSGQTYLDTLKLHIKNLYYLFSVFPACTPK